MFWLPIEQYQKDGRIVRGLQRGANSFTTSTAMAALEITTRLVQAIQVGFPAFLYSVVKVILLCRETMFFTASELLTVVEA